VVRDVRQLGALLREASSILSESFSLLLFALAEIPRISGPYVGPFEVAFEYPDQVCPIMDLVGWEFLEPSSSSVGEEKRYLPDDGSIVPSSASQLTG